MTSKGDKNVAILAVGLGLLTVGVAFVLRFDVMLGVIVAATLGLLNGAIFWRLWHGVWFWESCD